MTSPTSEQIDATADHVRAGLTEMRAHGRAIRAEVQFLRWLADNDPERMEFPA